jgi:hypothetical protein
VSSGLQSTAAGEGRTCQRKKVKRQVGVSLDCGRKEVLRRRLGGGGGMVRRGRRKMVKAAPQDLPSISQGRETPDPPGDFKA